MKRLPGHKYVWTDHGDSFSDSVFHSLSNTSDGEAILFWDEIYDNLSTYDYAVDLRSVLSEIIQELLK